MHQKQTKMARKRDIIFKKAEEKTIWNANIKMPDYNLHSLEPIKKELFDATKITLLDWIKKNPFISIICFTFVPCPYDNVLTMVYNSLSQVTSIICRACRSKEKSQSMAIVHTNTIRPLSVL